MTWTLNNQPLHPGQSFDIDGVQYPANALDLWARADLEALGLTWVEPEPVVATLEQRLAELADLRWRHSQHMIYDGVMTQADPAIAVVNATLAMRARRGVPPEAKQTWKLSQADFRQWDESEIEAFGFAIADHIQGCFDREAALTDALIAADGPASIDITSGWPS